MAVFVLLALQLTGPATIQEGETLRLFADWGLLTAETTPELIALAQKKGQTAVLSFLMDYQHRHFATTRKKKTFEL